MAYSISDESISQKIEKANFLINKVKQTLEEIKLKEKSKEKDTSCSNPPPENIQKQNVQNADKTDIIVNSIQGDFSTTETDDKENFPMSIESEDQKNSACTPHDNILSVYNQQFIPTYNSPENFVPIYTSPENDYIYTPHEPFESELARPKTRRNTEEGQETLKEITDKFRSKPDGESYLVEMMDFDAVQTKLNTIVERSETESSTTDMSKKSRPRSGKLNCTIFLAKLQVVSFM